jgi:hypothetical protein
MVIRSYDLSCGTMKQGEGFREEGNALLYAEARWADEASKRSLFLFIDRYVAYRRDDHSSIGHDQMEVEANAFGAALLMPARLVRAAIKRHDFDLDDEEDVSALAQRFNVSASAMSYRLINVGLLQ